MVHPSSNNERAAQLVRQWLLAQQFAVSLLPLQPHKEIEP